MALQHSTGVKEMWTEVPKHDKGKKKSNPVNKDCYISKMFLLWELSHYGNKWLEKKIPNK
uniref:Small nuclear ribonucleoprotein Sm D2 n=1 Tax=Mus spicilegus TaxID=10103 RepID=A0A8C6IB05_MUSSI